MKKIQTKITEEILKMIEKYSTILVFRHDSPDYDALGSQFGMVEFLKENFKNKTILAPGFSNVILAPGLYPNNDVIGEEIYNSKFLAIILDTGNTKRISDQNYKKADYIIKIDHHPNVEPYGVINLVDEDASACSELLYRILTSKTFKKYKMNDLAKKYFFSAIVGDTGRFQFSNTSSTTLGICSNLLKGKFDLTNDVYFPMYKKSIKEMKAMQYVLNNYKISEHGVAYYYLDSKVLKEFGLDCDEAKIFLSLFSSYEEIKIWVSLSEDDRKNNIRGSVRSRNIPINDVCANYNGGGHANAAGTRMDTYEECMKLIDDLDKKIMEN